MQNLTDRMSGLSASKQALLSLILKQKGQAFNTFQLSLSQQRLWFLDQLEPNSTAYIIPAAVRLKGKLNLEALERGFNEIIRRHESLRTTFANVDGDALQIITAFRPMQLQVLDLQSYAEREREEELLRVAGEEARRGFDLGVGPLLRASLVRLGSDDHALLMSMHHIISDAWSFGIFVRELTVLYETYSAGEESPLEELPIQYADYAVWQREWLRGEVLDSQLRHWCEKLRGAPIVLELPTDRQRPAVQSYRGAVQSFIVEAEVVEGLKQLGRREEATLFMTLLAAFATLLYRFTGQQDILVGTDIANRHHAETERLIGFFVNQLVLRCEVDGEETFRELLRRIREVALEAYANQDVPFDRLVDELQPERTLSHNPLFQVMFTLENAPIAPVEIGGLTLNVMPVNSGTSQFDLALEVTDEGRGLSGLLRYNTDIFEDETISRLISHYRCLLEAAVANPSVPVSALPLLSPAEREHLRSLADGSAVDLPLHHSFCVLFEAQAERSPHASAVACQDVSFSYYDLNTRSNRLAHLLRQHGAGPEVLVALLSERGPELLCAMLAVFKVGAAYLPLDTRHPPHRLRQVLGQSRSPIVLTAGTDLRYTLEQALADWPEGQRPILLSMTEVFGAPNPDGGLTLAEEQGSDNLNRSEVSQPGNLAYVIYTSGSTGQPKGAMVEQRGMLNHLFAKQHDLQLTHSDIIAQTAAPCFDISVWQSLAALIVGGCVQVLPDEVAHDAGRVLSEVEQRGITVLEVVPSLLRAVLEYTEAAAVVHSLKRLRWLLVTGEALPVELSRRWLSSYPHVPIVNAYGPTECSDDVTHYVMSEQPSASLARVPIGRAVLNTRLHVLNERLEPSGVGIWGELYVGGFGVGRGYYQDAARTAEAFVPDPFDHSGGQRLYRTGDKCRYLRDGNLEFLGRIDHQVKVRGYRIELEEIEAVLNQHPQVRQSIVVADDAAEDGEQRQLIGYVVLSPDEKPTVQQERLNGTEPQGEGLSTQPEQIIVELCRYLKERLPEYMVPAAFGLIEALPLTANGKIDRRALLSAERVLLRASEPYAAPGTRIEEVLARVWSEVLKVARVGIHDNFFALGGDSILSIQIIARAQQAGVRLTPRQLFEHQTIADLARVAEDVVAPNSQQGAVSGLVKMTPIQHWFFEQDIADRNHYNQALLLEVAAGTDAAWLERGTGEVLRHHDALRMRFRRDAGGMWLQENLAEQTERVFMRVDHSGVDESRQRDLLEKLAGAVQRSLNIERGPVVRAVYVHLQDGQPGRLLLVIHHLVVDGVSWRILLEDIERACLQQKRGEEIRLPPKTNSMQQWGHALSEYAQEEDVRSEVKYWLGEEWEEAVEVESVRERHLESGARQLVVELGQEQTRALVEQVGKVYRTQINEVLLTALAEAYGKWRGERRPFVVEVEGHGREEIEPGVDVTRTVGWFTSQYPVLLNIEGKEGFGERIKAVKEQFRVAGGHGENYGVARYLTREEGLCEKLKSLPQAEILFNYLGQLDRVLPQNSIFGAAQESVGSSSSPLNKRSHPIEINGSIIRGQLRLEWTYSETVCTPASIEKLANDFLEALQGLIEHCLGEEAGGYTPSDFPLARLEQQKLDLLAEIDRDIEDIYPLAPLQEGLLFHTLYAPTSGVYVGQLNFTLEGHLDAAMFEKAWQQVVDGHPILRTTFHWEHLGKPLQVVRANGKIALQQHDWRALSPAERREKMDAFLAADRSLGFDLSCAPLMRLATVRVTETTYQFIWSTHHLLLDGWSLSLVLREVFTCYHSMRTGARPPTVKARLYSDYVRWLQQQDISKAEVYWRKVLKGFEAPTPLQFDRLRDEGAANEASYEEEEAALPVTVTSALQRLARREQLTINTIVQGAWALLLSRYSGEDDVVFGGTVSGRPPTLKGVESMVGLFINTLPVRISTGSDAPVLEWLRETQRQQVELRQYEYSSLVEVQGWSEVPRGVALFDTMLAFENFPISDSFQRQMKEQGAEVGIIGVRSKEQSNYPLTVIVVPAAELSLKISYDVALFNGDTIRLMLGHFRNLLESIITNPYQRPAAVEMLTSAERRRMLDEWNNTAVAYPESACIHQLFEAQVEKTPEAIALVCEEEELTYREVNARANQLAHYLLRSGVGPESRVGVFMERSLDLMTGLLGILKAGGTYVPMDPSYPRERLAFMLFDAGVEMLLTQKQFEDSLPPHGGQVFRFDVDWELTAGESRANPSNITSADQAAYVIYTSGSTGRPKGVVGLHKGAVNRFDWMWRSYPFGEGEVCCQKTSVSFVDFVWESFGALLQGIRTVIIPEHVSKDTHLFVRELARQKVTRIVLVPSLLNSMLESNPDLQGTLPQLRFWVTSGEALSAELARKFKRSLPTSRLINLYGSSEVSADVTYFEVGGESEEGMRVGIGVPMSNTEIYLLDGRLEPVPVGVVGELYVGGANLARGYLGRAELTAEKFVPNPFAREPGARVFRTGDLARYQPDGNVEYVGRVDHQVKIRGFRIELGEIEAALAEHPAVKEKVVVVREEASGEKLLLAYVVGAEQATASELRRFLSERLPDFMVPSSFVLLDALPVTPSGKLDRNALPEPGRTRQETDLPYAAPRTPLEEVLVGIWEEVLGVDQIGVYDNFFSAGGHSLLATQIVSRIRDAFEVELPLRRLFEMPTIARLAEGIETAWHEAEGLPPLAPVALVSRDEEIPLSFAQQPWWQKEQKSPRNFACAIPMALRLSGEIDIPALERSFNEIIRRHESLRTSFANVNGGALQIIAPFRTMQLQVLDLQSSPEREREQELLRIAGEEARRAFDLRVGPLLRASLVRMGADDQALLVSVHRISADGWSIGVLLRELTILYDAYSAGEESPLEELPIQYADYAVWQRGRLQGEVLERHLKYWTQQLAGGASVPELPTDFPRRKAENQRGDSHSFLLAKSLCEKLSAFNRQESATMYMTLLAALQTLVHRYSGLTDIRVGSPVANRTHAELEGLIGCFSNTLVMRGDLSGNPTFRELLGRVREVTLGAYAHQDLPYIKLLEAMRPEDAGNRQRLFQVMFVLLNAPMPEVDVADLMPVSSTTSRFELILTMARLEEGLEATFEYNAELFARETVERLAIHYVKLLERVAANPDLRLSNLLPSL